MRLGSSKSLHGIKSIDGGVIETVFNERTAVFWVSPVNMFLMSDNEQEVLCDRYRLFLNSLRFSFQVLVRTREYEAKKYFEQFASNNGGSAGVASNNLHELFDDEKICVKNFYIVVSVKANTKNEASTQGVGIEDRCSELIEGVERLGLSVRRLKESELVDFIRGAYK